MQDESESVVKEMYGHMRSILSTAFATTPTLEYRNLYVMAYNAAPSVRLAISYEKGFPYVSYATDPLYSLSKKRNVTKFGRWYKSCVNPTVPDHVLGEAVDRLRAIAEDAGLVLGEGMSVEVVEGMDICELYKNAVGGRSCMAGSAHCFTEFYAINPRVVRMAVTSNRKGRALLWTTEQGHVVMDRIYPNSGFITQYLKNWALQQGYLIRTDQALPSGQRFVDAAGKEQSQLTVQFDKYAYGTIMPYMDSFGWLDSNLTERRLYMRRVREAHYALQSTGGGPFGGFQLNIPREMYADSNFGYGTVEQHFNPRAVPPLSPEPDDDDPDHFVCSSCAGTFHYDDMHTDEHHGDYCPDCYWETHFTCDRCGCTQDAGNSYCVGDEHYCRGCYENHTSTCENCSETYDDSVCFVVMHPSGNYWCPECAEDHRCMNCNTFNDTIGECECRNVPTQEAT